MCVYNITYKSFLCPSERALYEITTQRTTTRRQGRTLVNTHKPVSYMFAKRRS